MVISYPYNGYRSISITVKLLPVIVLGRWTGDDKSVDDCHRTVGNFRIAGGHVIFVIENGFQLLRIDYISLREPSLRK
jgi:hypothetical protein